MWESIKAPLGERSEFHSSQQSPVHKVHGRILKNDFSLSFHLLTRPRRMLDVNLQQRHVSVYFEVTEVLTESWSPSFEIDNGDAVESLVTNEAVNINFKLPQMQIDTSILGQATVTVK